MSSDDLRDAPPAREPSASPSDTPGTQESISDLGGPFAYARTDSYHQYFERSADAILIIDGERFVDCNRATVEMLRYDSKDELLSTHPSELSPPSQPDGRDSYEKAQEMMALAFERGNHRFEWDHVRSDGEIFPVEVLLTAVRVDGRRCLHVVWRDITERRDLEVQLRQSQKMEAIGQLVGGLAHDFNNLLMVINGNADLLGEALADEPELALQALEIRQSGERAADLTRQLLAFSRRQIIQPRIVDLAELVTEAASLLKRLVDETFSLEVGLTPRPLRVKVDPNQLQQVLMNLVTNARDAMPGGGRIRILTRERTVRGDQEADIRGGVYALLTVVDEGVGMDEGTRRRAFEPFFTTKSMGQGTGLGLSMVYGTVRQADGDVRLRSEPGVGTEVEIWLPRVKLAAGADPATSATAERSEVGGRVLVVGDEPAIAGLVVKALRRAGHRVLEADDGVEALELLEAEGGEVDLVVTDVVMPRMGGPELVRRLRKKGHDPSVLFVSGYIDDALGEIGTHDVLMEKPFTARQLMTVARRLLDDRAP